MTRSELLAEQGAWQDLRESRGWRLLQARARRTITEGRDRLEIDTPHTQDAARLQGRIAALREVLRWPEERLAEIAQALAREGLGGGG